jgi:ADP-ribosylglycohydrolase
VPETSSFAGQEGAGNNGGYAPDVLRAALFFVGTSSSFNEALEQSLAFAGPANYCPVLAGAIGGARWGASTILQPAVVHVDILPRVRTVAEALATGWRQ